MKKLNKIEPIEYEKIGDAYKSGVEPYTYYSPRYKKSITIPAGYPSNGANLVKDRVPTAFFVHDRGCEWGLWSDGTKMCNRELSFVYYDILRVFDVAWFYSFCRLVGTFIGGGGAARKNGLWRVRNP